MLITAMTVGGNYLKQYLTFVPPQVFTFLEEKKMYVLLINFFVMGQLSTFLSKTDAFEVMINHQPVLSKLRDKFLPSLHDIIREIERMGLTLQQ
jgi:hypothetical protein